MKELEQSELFPENLPEPKVKPEDVFEDTIECFVCTCGSTEVYVDFDEQIGSYFVSCANKKCSIEHEDEDENEAITKWNLYQELAFKTEVAKPKEKNVKNKSEKK